MSTGPSKPVISVVQGGGVPTNWTFLVIHNFLDGYMFMERVTPGLTVWDLKNRMQRIEKIPVQPHLQKLIYNGRELNNEERLIDIVQSPENSVQMDLIEIADGNGSGGDSGGSSIGVTSNNTNEQLQQTTTFITGEEVDFNENVGHLGSTEEYNDYDGETIFDDTSYTTASDVLEDIEELDELDEEDIDDDDNVPYEDCASEEYSYDDDNYDDEGDDNDDNDSIVYEE